MAGEEKTEAKRVGEERRWGGEGEREEDPLNGLYNKTRKCFSR